ncbi:MAG: DUF1302 domain-containing protein [Burkholderiales bacterium]|nr:DUF1302 domain-containing protein [Burkholderiales bacterium]
MDKQRLRARQIATTRRRPLTTAVTLALLGGAASAAEFDTGNPDLKLRWDNTVKYSAAVRTGKPSDTLLSNANNDDGDRNFKRGLISNRLDLFSELDAQIGNFGARVSAAAWYDTAYNRSNDNPGFARGAAPNQVSVPYNEFTDATRTLHGRKAEVLDAFAFGRFDLGESRATFRFGRHSVLWGESLFFGANAIAGGQSPVDAIKLLSVPGTQFKEAIRPVPQLSGQLQVSPSVSLGAYYQFRWEKNRLPAVGSYFSQVDVNPDGTEQLLLPQAANGGIFLDGNAPRLADQKARNSGQGGLQLRFRGEDTDFGAYLIRLHDKTHQQISNLGVRSVIYVPGPGCVVGGSFATGASRCGLIAPASYRLVYHEGITALGFSASRTFDGVNLAAEVSYRRNQDLASSQAVDTSALGGPATDNADNPGYAVGNTAHVNLSMLWQMPSTPLFREATMAGEIAWNRVLKITKNPSAVDPNASRVAVALRLTLEPMYRQALSGLDLGVPIGLGWSPKGSRSMALGPGTLPADGGGDLTLGLNGTYLDAWRIGLAYTHYFGAAGTFIEGSDNHYSYKQSLKDRDFVSLSVRRTF